MSLRFLINAYMGICHYAFIHYICHYGLADNAYIIDVITLSNLVMMRK